MKESLYNVTIQNDTHETNTNECIFNTVQNILDIKESFHISFLKSVQ